MNNKRYAYYSGCSLESTAKEYNDSLKEIFKVLGVEIEEPDDWSCCGSTPAHTVDPLLACALGARNLSLIEKMGLETVIAPCPSCFAVLKRAHLKMKKDPEMRERINELIDEPYNLRVSPKSALQILYEDIPPEKISEMAVYEIPELKVVPYYGCIVTRPKEVAEFDDPENPISMDRILESAGITVLDFPFKTECCGAAFGVVKRDVVNKLSSKVLSMAKEVGANCVAVCCPLCQQNLDLRQDQINSLMKTDFKIPVLYFSQLLGLVFGISPDKLGINKLVVSAQWIVDSLKKAEKRGKKIKEEPEAEEEQ
jgi:heterodisulfide reductase subunit B